MIGELGPTQVGQERVLAFRTPTVRAVALVAEFFLPCIQRCMKPFPFLGREEAHHGVGVDLGAFDTQERMRVEQPPGRRLGERRLEIVKVAVDRRRFGA